MSAYSPDDDYSSRTLLVGCLTIVLLAIAVPVGLWMFGVFSSGPIGAGNVLKDRNSSQNIEHWSATFNGEYNDIQSDVANLAVLKSAETEPGATQQDRVNYTGAQTVCDQDAAAYNANTRNTLAVVPSGLPATIPLTTCGATS